jgi:hypothetical protein
MLSTTECQIAVHLTMELASQRVADKSLTPYKKEFSGLESKNVSKADANMPHRTSSTTTDLGGSVTESLPPSILAPSNAAGCTVLGAVNEL